MCAMCVTAVPVLVFVLGACSALADEAVSSELHARGITVNGETVANCERRTFADGEAIRYRLPEGARHVTAEATEWALPEGAHVWFQPEWRGKIHYEAPYTNATVAALRLGQKMSFPVTAKLPDGSYRLMTEANVVDYTDGCAVYLGGGRFGIEYYADTNGFDQVGADTTPWRVMLKAKDLQHLATSDIVRRLCPEPSSERLARARKFVRPGRCTWQWLPAGDPVYAEQKAWYDQTKALGFEYYLIDDGWKTWRDGKMDQWACLKKWIDYGKSIGVESFVWVDSKEMRTPEARHQYLSRVKEVGAVGIKIDFIPKPSCQQMKWYEETSAETFDLGLMLDYHGAVKPSGREKCWPHEVAREGIRGHEWHITRYRRVLPPEHDCILPFTRLVQGHADYTPVVFEEKELQGFTWARELAQGVVFSAPFLCFGDYPQNYLKSPAADFIRGLPSVYDEVRILPGSEIGGCIAVAKRRGDGWWIAVENGSEPRTLEIKLDFLEGGYGLTEFRDCADRPDGFETGRVERVGREDVIRLSLRPGGGYAAQLCRCAESVPGFAWNGMFTDHMVLQREKPVRVWGTANPSDKVVVSFAGQVVPVVADAEGCWCATLQPLAASSVGCELTATCGGKTLRATDVLVGEVWLCSGQSNMEQPLWHGGWGGGWSDRKGVIESNLATYSLIRAYKVPSVKAERPQENVNGVWRSLTDPQAIRSTYAVGFYFARTLQRAIPDLPIGIVEAAWGGQNIQQFTPDESAGIYNGVIHPLRRFALRGVLWYQGEGNLRRDGARYKDRLHQLVKGWRQAFDDAELPFYLSELAPFDWGKDGLLAEFQAAQRQFAAEEPHTACICINDCGNPDTIHPDRKELVGIRFALVALNRLYGRTDLVCDAPMPVEAYAEAGAAIVRFSNARQLGVCSQPHFVRHTIRGFELAGADGVWKPAVQVEIIGAKIRASSPDVPDPREVRYLWRNVEQGEIYAADSNLQVPSFRMKVAPTTLDPELQAKCQSVCDWAVETGLQGAVQFCAYRDGKCIVDVCAGTMTTNAGAAAVNGSTLYPVFSTEKPLLATTVHRLVEKGKMDYDKPLSTWWPGFVGDGKEKLTLGLTLAYRSGLGPRFPKGIETVDDECNWQKICSLAEREPPVEEVGVRQHYMSISYAWALGRPLEGAAHRPLNDILVDEVLRPCGIEHDFYFAADDAALKRIGTAYMSESYMWMNDDRRRRMCLPSAFAVANARSIARFYNRLCGFDGEPPLLKASTLEAALKPSRHPSDPLPPPAEINGKWCMLFGMGYGLWGEAENLSRVFGHGGIGGSEGLCDRSHRLTVGFTCSFAKDVRKVRSKLYGVVGMKWRYWDDAEADIQNMQMSTLVAQP